MEYFKSGLKSVLGTPQDSQQPTAAETIERLVDRVQTSTLLEDRRDACRALKALSSKFRLEIGAQAMDALIRVLECDRADNEIIGYALDAICNVVNGPRDDENMDYISDNGDDFGLQFTEIFIKQSENVKLLLDLIEEFDFKVRWPIVRLLSGLLSHRPKDLQECILVSPRGVSRLMDLLSDTREIIRNDTLLLLEHLTKSNANIQKIVAFENAFDKLLSIISEEGYSDGGVVVGDCLRVMLTLLKNNVSNQTFFKEGSYIKHLAPFFELPESSERAWTPQKSINALTMLQIIRVLVSPNNPAQVTMSAQKAMFQCGLLEQLCVILMASGVPADVLTEAINAVAELIRGNHSNQEYFSTVCAPTTPPRPAIVILLMAMVNDKQPFSLRCSVLYCFQCFLYKNELGQAQIIQTLLPSTADVSTVTVGQLLCGGLFSADSLSNWFAAVALSHALVDNSTQKEQLLRVQLATNVGNPAVSLINQCALMLQQGGKLQTRLGLLMLMSTWLASCTIAVMQFLSIPTNIPFLTSQVSLAEGDEHEDLIQGICAFLLGICIEFNDNSQPSFTKDDLCQLVVKRIGLETFLDKLTAVTKNENYSRVAHNPHLNFKQPFEVLFDFEFCRLFKSFEGTIIEAVKPKPKLQNGHESSMTPEQQELLRQYKDLIRDQDQQIHKMKDKISDLEVNYETAKVQVEDMTSTIQQVKDQNALLKAQRSVSGNSTSQEVLQLKQEIEQLKLECISKEVEINANKELLQRNQVVDSFSLSTGDAGSGNRCNLKHEIVIESQTTEIENLKKEIESYKEQIQNLATVNTSHGIQDITSNVQHNRLLEEKQSLEFQLISIRKEKEDLRLILSQKDDQLAEFQKKYASEDQDHEAQKKKLLAEKSTVEEQLNSIRKEQEDMLVLLTEQGDKLAEYRKRLKALGQQVEDDEDEDDYINDDSEEFGDDDVNDFKDDISDLKND